MSTITLDGLAHQVPPGQRLIDTINRAGIQLLQICHHPQLGPIHTHAIRGIGNLLILVNMLFESFGRSLSDCKSLSRDAPLSPPQ